MDVICERGGSGANVVTRRNGKRPAGRLSFVCRLVKAVNGSDRPFVRAVWDMRSSRRTMAARGMAWPLVGGARTYPPILLCPLQERRSPGGRPPPPLNPKSASSPRTILLEGEARHANDGARYRGGARDDGGG